MQNELIVLYLLQLLKNVRQCPWDNASVTVALCATGDGEGLTTACLPICKDGAIVTSQGTTRRNDTLLTSK